MVFIQWLGVAGNIDVQFLDENIAGAWADSAAAVEEMAEQPSHVRRGVGLGRCLLEQLPVVASLCGALLTLSTPLPLTRLPLLWPFLLQM